MTDSIKTPRLSGNMLKLIACAAMVVDHLGLMCFRDDTYLRIIGRLAFPIFAFMIAEGARHTRNRLRYFLTMLTEGVLMQLVYTGLLRDNHLNIFITFSISILLIYAFDYMKRTLISRDSPRTRLLSVSLFVGGVVATYLFCRKFTVDYGFFGVMTPVITSSFMYKSNDPSTVYRYDRNVVHVAACGVALLMVALTNNWDIQYYSLFALPLLVLYSGNRGRARLKWFFYLFYPLHIAAIAILSLFINAAR